MTTLAPIYDFHGHPVRRLTYRGELAFLGRGIGAALGYDRGGKRFISQFTTDWAGEIRENVHWFRVKGDELRALKAQMSGAWGFAGELVLLTERGVTMALFRSGKPCAFGVWTWLTTDVLPPEPAAPALEEREAVRVLLDNGRLVADDAGVYRDAPGAPLGPAPTPPSVIQPGPTPVDLPTLVLAIVQSVRTLLEDGRLVTGAASVDRAPPASAPTVSPALRGRILDACSSQECRSYRDVLAAVKGWRRALVQEAVREMDGVDIALVSGVYRPRRAEAEPAGSAGAEVLTAALYALAAAKGIPLKADSKELLAAFRASFAEHGEVLLVDGMPDPAFTEKWADLGDAGLLARASETAGRPS